MAPTLKAVKGAREVIRDSTVSTFEPDRAAAERAFDAMDVQSVTKNGV
jgi:hypothetical protein